jgi:hypothetical protein
VINPLVLYSTVGALVAGLLAGWTVRDWKADSDQLAQVERANKAEKAAIAAVFKPSQELETTLAALRPAQIETRNTIREVYRNVEVPTDCAVPPAGVGLLEGVLGRANAAATGQSGPELRRAPEAAAAPD